jgi:CTP:phosphocholine cytidylyltransferase-like protein
LLGDLNAKVGREDIFKPTVGSKSLCKIINDNRVRGVEFATSKNLILKNVMFHVTSFINSLRHLMERHTVRLSTL